MANIGDIYGQGLDRPSTYYDDFLGRAGLRRLWQRCRNAFISVDDDGSGNSKSLKTLNNHKVYRNIKDPSNKADNLLLRIGDVTDYKIMSEDDVKDIINNITPPKPQIDTYKIVTFRALANRTDDNKLIYTLIVKYDRSVVGIINNTRYIKNDHGVAINIDNITGDTATYTMIMDIPDDDTTLNVSAGSFNVSNGIPTEAFDWNTKTMEISGATKRYNILSLGISSDDENNPDQSKINYTITVKYDGNIDNIINGTNYTNFIRNDQNLPVVFGSATADTVVYTMQVDRPNEDTTITIDAANFTVKNNTPTPSTWTSKSVPIKGINSMIVTYNVVSISATQDAHEYKKVSVKNASSDKYENFYARYQYITVKYDKNISSIISTTNNNIDYIKTGTQFTGTNMLSFQSSWAGLDVSNNDDLQNKVVSVNSDTVVYRHVHLLDYHAPNINSNKDLSYSFYAASIKCYKSDNHIDIIKWTKTTDTIIGYNGSIYTLQNRTDEITSGVTTNTVQSIATYSSAVNNFIGSDTSATTTFIDTDMNIVSYTVNGGSNILKFTLSTPISTEDQTKYINLASIIFVGSDSFGKEIVKWDNKSITIPKATPATNYSVQSITLSEDISKSTPSAEIINAVVIYDKAVDATIIPDNTLIKGDHSITVNNKSFNGNTVTYAISAARDTSTFDLKVSAASFDRKGTTNTVTTWKDATISIPFGLPFNVQSINHTISSETDTEATAAVTVVYDHPLSTLGSSVINLFTTNKDTASISLGDVNDSTVVFNVTAPKSENVYTIVTTANSILLQNDDTQVTTGSTAHDIEWPSGTKTYTVQNIENTVASETDTEVTISTVVTYDKNLQ